MKFELYRILLNHKREILGQVEDTKTRDIY